MYTFDIFRNKTLVCVGGGYPDLDSAKARAIVICKERKATNYTIFKVVDGERMFLDSVDIA
jgi:alcohol dehydrogenase class IV